MLENLRKTTQKLKILNSLIILLFVITLSLMLLVLVVNEYLVFFISYQSAFTGVLIITGVLVFICLLLFDKLRSSGDYCFESLVDQSHAGTEANSGDFKSSIKAYSHSAELPVFKGKQGLLLLAFIDLQIVIFCCAFQV